MPGLEGVAVQDLPTNADVLNRFRPRVQLAVSFIVDNMDTPELLEAALPRFSAQHRLFVDYVTPQQQNQVGR